MEPICNGSGKATYYTSKGERLLLCETFQPHIHCDCGDPLIGAAKGDRCRDCNKRTAGLSLHHKKPHYETREHISGLQKYLEGSPSN